MEKTCKTESLKTCIFKMQFYFDERINQSRTLKFAVNYLRFYAAFF